MAFVFMATAFQKLLQSPVFFDQKYTICLCTSILWVGVASLAPTGGEI
jgi:hypothetical protein